MADVIIGEGPAPKGGNDPADMTDRYNTKLTPEEEAAFLEWARSGKRDYSKDTFDYDMRGFWKAMMQGDEKAKTEMQNGNPHFPDTYKKPNHPSFSNESKYHGADGHQGGRWSTRDGKDVFTPGPGNLKYWEPAALAAYFAKYGDGAVLDGGQ